MHSNQESCRVEAGSHGRALIACRNCRKRKIRCQGQDSLGRCQNCRSFGIECVFERVGTLGRMSDVYALTRRLSRPTAPNSLPNDPYIHLGEQGQLLGAHESACYRGDVGDYYAATSVPYQEPPSHAPRFAPQPGRRTTGSPATHYAAAALSPVSHQHGANRGSADVLSPWSSRFPPSPTDAPASNTPRHATFANAQQPGEQFVNVDRFCTPRPGWHPPAFQP